MKETYYTLMCVRDSEKSIYEVMTSLVSQTYQPGKVIVVNDGSTDKTSDILTNFKNNYPDLIEVLGTDSKTRDYARIPRLWNMCLQKDYDYHLIAAGDSIFSQDYAEKIITKMSSNPRIAIASGIYGKQRIDFPHGAGRFVKQSFFFKFYDKYPEKIGYETETVYRALINNYEIAVFKDAKFEHAEKLGHKHNFIEWGQSMKAMGYHPLYVLGRCFLELAKNDNIGRKGSLNMLWNYLTFKPQKSGYFTLFSQDVRHQIREIQSREIKHLLKEAFTKSKK